jgi:hypothetical protein
MKLVADGLLHYVERHRKITRVTVMVVSCNVSQSLCRTGSLGIAIYSPLLLKLLGSALFMGMLRPTSSCDRISRIAFGCLTGERNCRPCCLFHCGPILLFEMCSLLLKGKFVLAYGRRFQRKATVASITQHLRGGEAHTETERRQGQVGRVEIWLSNFEVVIRCCKRDRDAWPVARASATFASPMDPGHTKRTVNENDPTI